MTFNATTATLLKEAGVIVHRPRLRWDQNLERYVYLIPNCRERVANLPDAPDNENPDPFPNEQVLSLFDRFASGAHLLKGFDYDSRGKGLFILRTRSVRLSGGFLSRDVFVGIDVRLRSDLNHAKGGTITSTKWYAQSRAHFVFTRLQPHFFQGVDPYAEARHD